MTQIIHFTTVHPRGDTRIRVKEVSSLAEYLDGDVGLYVQDGKGSECDEAAIVEVVDTGLTLGGRGRRMVLGAWRMYRAVRTVRPRVAHFHDPELIPVGLALKLSGIKVVYDVHEDVPRQILGKHWISAWLRRPVAWAAEAFEWLAGRVFDGVVAATPTIARRFPDHKTITVQNFPILAELVAPDPVPYEQRPPHFAYVGGITGIRGSRDMVEATGRVGQSACRLQLAGGFSPATHGDELAALPGWQRVVFHGWASRPEVAAILGNVRAGLVLFHPAPNHLDAQPNKMFEYMAAGLPIIASDFPLWREIVDGAGCGLLVDPQDPAVIAAAMEWLLAHPEEAEAMGRRGREAVEREYSWAPEAEKLLTLYRRLLR
ncbi:glycosyltransferase family 4 protein [Thioalkalivibrio sp. HL-Eb18]|uniref:glycosyltransferase family 4 protein n=1 Tax=Thioalkalivibrio sp. HL-Eb18 TaxID=1266913 RepID=UPI0004777826|nr:glycosyltransferase family 4 protein [Thioalkalivibrio sp. HL-Eb18]